MRPILPKPSSGQNLGLYQRVQAKRPGSNITMLIPTTIADPKRPLQLLGHTGEIWRRTPVPGRVRCSTFSDLHFFPTREPKDNIDLDRASQPEQPPTAVTYVYPIQSRAGKSTAKQTILHTSASGGKIDFDIPNVYTNPMYRNLHDTEKGGNLVVKEKTEPVEPQAAGGMQKNETAGLTDMYIVMPELEKTKAYVCSIEGHELPRDLDQAAHLSCPMMNCFFQNNDIKQKLDCGKASQYNENESLQLRMNANSASWGSDNLNECAKDTSKTRTPKGYIAKITVGSKETEQSQAFYWTHVPNTKATIIDVASTGNVAQPNQYLIQTAKVGSPPLTPKELLKGDSMQVAIAQRAREEMEKRRLMDTSPVSYAFGGNGERTYHPPREYGPLEFEAGTQISEESLLLKGLAANSLSCKTPAYKKERKRQMKRKCKPQLETMHEKPSKKKARKTASDLDKKMSAKSITSEGSNLSKGEIKEIVSVGFRTQSDVGVPGEFETRKDDARKKLSDSLDLQLVFKKFETKETDAKIAMLQVFLEQQQKKLEDIRRRRRLQT